MKLISLDTGEEIKRGDKIPAFRISAAAYAYFLGLACRIGHNPAACVMVQECCATKTIFLEPRHIGAKLVLT